MAAENLETRIKVKSHSTKCVEGVYSLYKSGELCDLTLKVGSSEFKVHKIILVSCSKYFKNMFAEGIFTESGKNYVELFEIDEDSFKKILDYFYSGYIALTQNSAEKLFRTADFFGLTAIKSICYKYLLENISVNNCVQRYYFGVKFGFKSLKVQAKLYIMQQLDEVSKTKEFCAINQDILKELLTSDGENHNAEQIYKATMEWVRHDLDNRKSLLSELLAFISAEEISYDFYVENMKNDIILRQDLKCISWLLDNIIDRFTNCTSCSESNIFITSREEYNLNCYQFKLESNELVNLAPRPTIILFSAFYYKTWIYLVTGDTNKQNVQNSVKYNTNCKCKWSKIDLNFNRCNSGTCILRDQLYVVGGFDCSDKSELKSCICYDFNSEKKYTIADMKEKSQVPGVCTYGNSIYTCCGDTNFAPVSRIQRLDPREGIWYDVGNYKVAKGICSSSVISNSLYAAILGRPIVERFDFRNNDSEQLPIPDERCGGCITSSNGKLFRAHQTGLAEYDADNNQWLEKSCEFNILCPVVVSWD